LAGGQQQLMPASGDDDKDDQLDSYEGQSMWCPVFHDDFGFIGSSRDSGGSPVDGHGLSLISN